MKIKPKTVDYLCSREKVPRPLLNLSITQFDPERKRVYSQPDTTLFQGRLASSHAKRAKSDRVSVWAREKERESGGEMRDSDREKQKERERERPRRQIKRARENKLESEMLVTRLLFRLSV